MATDIDFLKNEVARLRAEQIMERNPIAKLAMEKEIQESLHIISALKNDSNIAGPYSFDDSNNALSQIEIKSVHNPATDPSDNESSKPIKSKISLYKIAEGVIAGILVLALAWVVAHYLGIQL